MDNDLKNDWNGINPVTPTNQTQQPLQQAPPLQQQQPMQQAQKRAFDNNDQNVSDSSKRRRVDNQEYIQNCRQTMQSQTPVQQFPLTQQSQHANMLHKQHPPSSRFAPLTPHTPLPPDPPMYPAYAAPTHVPQQPQPLQLIQQQLMQPMQHIQNFPITSTPNRNSGVLSCVYTPSSANPFMSTPLSGGPSATAIPSIVVQTPLSSRVFSHQADDKVIFKEVVSVLSLERGINMKITLGEIRRRIRAPECMEIRQLARLTRYPKSSYRDFVKTFTKHRFDEGVNEGQSKANGVIASLIEDEAQLLAKDFTKLISSELSLPSLAVIVAWRAGSNVVHLLDFFQPMKELLWCVREHMLSAGRTPEDILDESTDPAVHIFSLTTHSFGPLAVVAVIDSFYQLINHIEASFPSPEQIQASSFGSMAAVAPLPNLERVNPSSNVSDLGCSFNAPPSTTTTTVKSKKISSADVDSSLLSFHSNDVDVYTDCVPPRIAFDYLPVAMTIGELRRRACGPEKFTVSLMNKYMRRGKKVKIHHDLRDSLGKLGITMNSKKGIKPTSWSSLSETEAIALSMETSNYLFPIPASQKIKQKVTDNPGAAYWIKSIASFIEAAMSRIGFAQSTVESEADLQMLRFALITHHFGHAFYATVMKWLRNVL